MIGNLSTSPTPPWPIVTLGKCFLTPPLTPQTHLPVILNFWIFFSSFFPNQGTISVTPTGKLHCVRKTCKIVKCSTFFSCLEQLLKSGRWWVWLNGQLGILLILRGDFFYFFLAKKTNLWYLCILVFYKKNSGSWWSFVVALFGSFKWFLVASGVLSKLNFKAIKNL